MKMSYKDFLEISFETFSENNISPKVDEDFRGLKIDLPKKIPICEKMKIPLVGTFQVDESILNKFKSFENEIVIVVKDLKTSKTYKSDLLENNYTPELSEPIEQDEEIENVHVQGWFNVDIKKQISNISKMPGEYQVFTIIGDMKSNVLTYELVK